jgi:DNA-binding MarR family transcriptional regulator
MNLRETVDYHLKATWHSLTKMYNQVAVKYETSQTIGYVLMNIEKEGTPATKIAPFIGMEPTSLSRLLNSMEKKGLIYREVDETDKRVVRIFLTDYGVLNRKIAKQTIIKFNEKILKKVTEKDLKIFYRVIAAINELATEEKLDNVERDEKPDNEKK